VTHTASTALASSSHPGTSGTRYRERLTVPPAWWVLSGLFALSMLLAFGLYLGPGWGLASALASFGAMALVFWRASTLIVVTGDQLLVGRANIQHRYLGGAVALDSGRARARRGPEADARAYLALRPYIDTAVEVAVTDPDDPAPYWLVATRRPRQLAAALGRDEHAAADAAPDTEGPGPSSGPTRTPG